MDLVEERLVDDAAGDRRLVGDDHQRVASALQQPQRIRRPRKQLEQLHAIEVAALFNERPVAVQEHGRLRHDGVPIRTRTDSNTRSGFSPVMHW